MFLPERSIGQSVPSTPQPGVTERLLGDSGNWSGVSRVLARALALSGRTLPPQPGVTERLLGDSGNWSGVSRVLARAIALSGRTLHGGGKGHLRSMRRAEALHYERGGVYADGKIMHTRRYTAPKSGSALSAVCYTNYSTETSHFDSCSPLV